MPSTTSAKCKSTIFAKRGDKMAGGKSRFLKRKVHPSDIGIAHRKIKLGTCVKVCLPRTGKCAVVVVLDRGPYGMRDAAGWFNATREPERKRAWLKSGGGYRGCADLTPGLAKRLGHDGMDLVTVKSIGRRARRPHDPAPVPFDGRIQCYGASETGGH